MGPAGEIGQQLNHFPQSIETSHFLTFMRKTFYRSPEMKQKKI